MFSQCPLQVFGLLLYWLTCFESFNIYISHQDFSKVVVLLLIDSNVKNIANCKERISLHSLNGRFLCHIMLYDSRKTQHTN